MVFTIDFLDDGRVLEWESTPDGTVVTERDGYTPRFFVGARAPDTDLDVTTLRAVYDRHPDVINAEVLEEEPFWETDFEDAAGYPSYV